MKISDPSQSPPNASRARAYFSWLERHRWRLNLGFVLITLFSVFLTSRLELKTDFAQLLPESLPSVQNLWKAADRVGGTGVLLVGVEGPEYSSNRRFIEDLAKRIDSELGGQLRYFEYRYNDVVEYAEKYGLHYLSTQQLTDFKAHLDREIERNKNKAFGSFLGLNDDGDDAAAKDRTSLSGTLDPSLRFFFNYRDGYLSTDEGRTMVIMLRPKSSSLSTTEGLKLTTAVRAIIADLKPATYHPKMNVDLGGDIQSAIDELQAVRHDIVDTALLLVVLILAVLLLYFWSVRLVALICVNLVFGVLWTFGATKLQIGYLNTQTAFLGSLVVGTGINYSVIFIARYLENRKHGIETREAIVRSISDTAISTLIASSTTAVGFVSLLLAQNRGLSQFGFIGSIGVAFCWMAAYSLLPLWLFQMESRWPKKSFRNPLGFAFAKTAVWAGNFVTRRAPAFAAMLVLIAIAGFAGFRHLASDPLEYNFDNLRNRRSLVSGTAAFEARIKRVFPASLTPSLVMFDSVEQAREFCPAIKQIAASLPPEKNLIQSCMSLFELLPKPQPDTAEHRAKMTELRAALGHRLLKFSPEAERLENLRQKMVFEPPTTEELPVTLKRRFTELDGRVGLIGFVNPSNMRSLNDGLNLLNYTDSLREIRLPQSGAVLSASGDSFILADLLRGLRVDGPRIAALSFFGVALIAVFLCGGLVNGLFMAACLVYGTWLMLCAQGYMDLKYNFFNFIALPLTFGIGVDYPINVFIRCRQEKFQNFGRVLATSGGAVILCSTTTTIGYYTLIGASNQALVSFARLAIIGEITCLLAAVVMVPVVLRLAGKFKTSGGSSGGGMPVGLPNASNPSAPVLR